MVSTILINLLSDNSGSVNISTLPLPKIKSFTLYCWKINKIPIVHVESDTKESLNKVVDKLMNYGIKSKIIEVWLWKKEK